MPFLILVRILLFAIALVSSGCSVFRASPGTEAGFIPNPELLVNIGDTSPFNRAYIVNRAELASKKSTYDKLYVRTVNTDFLTQKLQGMAEKDDDVKERLEEVNEMARYLHDRFVYTVTEYPNFPYKIVTVPGPKTFILDLALVELHPTLPIWNGIGNILALFIPGGGAVSLLGTGSIAMEGLIRDGETADILVAFRDRQKDKSSLFTIRDFEKYAHARVAIDEWAEAYAELSAAPLGTKVDGPIPFTLNPF